MALFGRHFCRYLQSYPSRLGCRSTQHIISERQFHASGCRQLYTSISKSVGIYRAKREDLLRRIGGLKEPFRLKVEDHLESSETNTIYKHDLQTMLHLAETDEDLKTLRKMIVRQNKYPVNFYFGPTLSRLLIHLDRPKLAYEWYTNPETKVIFNEPTSILALADFLFDKEMYAESMEIFETVRTLRPDGHNFFNHNMITLYFAACAKQGTEEALEKCHKLIQELRKADFYYTNRTIGYASFLALELGRPEIALDFLNFEKRTVGPERGGEQASTFIGTVHKNLLIKTYTMQGNLRRALNDLEGLVEDISDNRSKAFHDVVYTLDVAISKSDDKMLMDKYTRVRNNLRNMGKLTKTSLENQMFSPIFENRQLRGQNFKLGHRERRNLYGQDQVGE